MRTSYLPAGLAAAALICLSPGALSQASTGWDLEPLVLVGDNIQSLGSVQSIDQLAVNSAGTWKLTASTTGPSNLLLFNGNVLLQAGQIAHLGPNHPGTTIDSIISMALTDVHDTIQLMSLNGTSIPGADSGAFLNNELLHLETVAVASKPGHHFVQFHSVETNAGNGMLLLAELSDTDTPGLTKQALLIQGTAQSSLPFVPLIKVAIGDQVSPGGATITSFSSTPQGYGTNTDGTLILYVDTDLAPGASGMVLLDGQVLATEGAASPVAGALWADLSGASVSLNDLQDHAYTGRLAGDPAQDEILIRNGQVLLREGMALAGLPGSTLNGFGQAALRMDSSGDLVWQALFTDSRGQARKAWMLNQLPAVVEGLSTVNGQVITSLSDQASSASIDSAGNHIAFQATLADGSTGAFMASKHLAFTKLRWGCQSSFLSPDLVALNKPVIGTVFDLSFNPQSPSALSGLAVSATDGLDANGCGTSIPGLGEVHLDLATTPEIFFLAAGETTGHYSIPNDPTLIGTQLFVQGVFLDPTFAPEPVRLSASLAVHFGF